MRLFISVAPPTEIQNSIASLQHSLAAALRTAGLADRLVNWSPVDKMHLTLRFLGDTRADQRPQLASALSALASRHVPFTLILRGVGAFPDWRKPNVLWLGIDESSSLRAIQAEVEVAARDAGFDAETRPWKAHLTLARSHKHARTEELRRLGAVMHAAAQEERVAQWQQTFTVGTIELMHSELLPGGARYTILASERLGHA